jgi:hypothetical protein
MRRESEAWPLSVSAGHPKADSTGSNSGPAGGGTAVEIRGENFEWVTGAFFGPGS